MRCNAIAISAMAILMTVPATAQQAGTTVQPAPINTEPAPAVGGANQMLSPSALAQTYQPEPTDQLATNLMGLTVFSILQDPAFVTGPAPGTPAPGAAIGVAAPSIGTGPGAEADATTNPPIDAANGQPGAPGAAAPAPGTEVDPTAGREAIGDITDFVLDAQGQVKAVVIGVGGFLGIGQKDVVVDYAQLRWAADGFGNQVLMLDTTREALENAPEFDADQIGAPVNADAPAVQPAQ